LCRPREEPTPSIGEKLEHAFDTTRQPSIVIFKDAEINNNAKVIITTPETCGQGVQDVEEMQSKLLTQKYRITSPHSHKFSMKRRAKEELGLY
jgi:hypothetical protein